jgi:hypothetical protein
MLIGLLVVGANPTSSDDAQKNPVDEGARPIAGKNLASKKVSPISYRSPGSHHKLVIEGRASDLEQTLSLSGAVTKIRRLGAYSILEVSQDALDTLAPELLARASLRDDLNLIQLKRGQIDTTGPDPYVPAQLRDQPAASHSLHLVQLFGPPTPDAMAALKKTGARIITYVPNNAYLVRATPDEVRALGRLSDIVQWNGPYHPAYKLDPRLKLDSTDSLKVIIQLLASENVDESIERLRAISLEVKLPRFGKPSMLYAQARLSANNLADLARIPDVLVIEPQPEIRLMDERANQIVAGALSLESINNKIVGRPSAPGYLQFLTSVGLDQPMDFAVDVGDTGLDIGSFEANQLHPDFLDSAGNSRVAYTRDYTGDFHGGDPSVLAAHDSLGHGTIDASIIGGLGAGTGSNLADAQGYRYGLGVAPFVRIGVSKLFDDNGSFLPDGVVFDQILFESYQDGARITSNSWGADCAFSLCNQYDTLAQIYDAKVRDAQPFTPGNQEMIAVFSSGNAGPQGVVLPGTAKNIITVGASESFRMTADDGSPITDGCGVPSTGADNTFDIPAFSSGGPLFDGRAKPDLVAPGTHITGAATRDRFFANRPLEELHVCDRFFPAGQTRYTLSSGTSHAAPVVSGAAALAYQWLRDRLGHDPSPAIVKALLLNSTKYLTGNNANDSLPGPKQGWGLLNLAGMFDNTSRIFYDQSPSRTFRESGGEPFEITGVISDSSKEFRAMLVWTDAPGSATSNAPNVNHLKIEVIIGGITYSGNNFSGQYCIPGRRDDIFNNVQGVRLPPGIVGPFVIRVKPVVIAGDGVPGNLDDLDQDFALVVSNAMERPLPVLSIEEGDDISEGVSVTHADSTTDPFLLPGETASISVAVKNESSSSAGEIESATLIMPGGASGTALYGRVDPGGSLSNANPFQVRVPNDLVCGQVAQLQLRLETTIGQILLPVRVRVGRPDGAGARTLLLDDVDSRTIKWKAKKGFALSASVGNSGIESYRAVDRGDAEEENVQISTLTLKKKVSIPANAGQVRLSFFHIFDFERGYDGGVLEISTDGVNWEDLGSRIISGGYDGKIGEVSDNPLGPRLAWTSRGRTGVFSPVVINLDDFAGEKIRIRFRAGFDPFIGWREGFTGWFIDDVRITANSYVCR